MIETMPASQLALRVLSKRPGKYLSLQEVVLFIYENASTKRAAEAKRKKSKNHNGPDVSAAAWRSQLAAEIVSAESCLRKKGVVLLRESVGTENRVTLVYRPGAQAPACGRQRALKRVSRLTSSPRRMRQKNFTEKKFWWKEIKHRIVTECIKTVVKQFLPSLLNPVSVWIVWLGTSLR